MGVLRGGGCPRCQFLATVGRDPSPTFHLPVVYLVNCPGFLIGLEVERTGTITGGITFAHG